MSGVVTELILKSLQRALFILAPCINSNKYFIIQLMHSIV